MDRFFLPPLVTPVICITYECKTVNSQANELHSFVEKLFILTFFKKKLILECPVLQ